MRFSEAISNHPVIVIEACRMGALEIKQSPVRSNICESPPAGIIRINIRGSSPKSLYRRTTEDPCPVESGAPLAKSAKVDSAKSGIGLRLLTGWDARQAGANENGRQA
ncbi:MAG: hypothetical protein ACLQBD_11420 [Syntrophobacteraceae bacterium]